MKNISTSIASWVIAPLAGLFWLATLGWAEPPAQLPRPREAKPASPELPLPRILPAPPASSRLALPDTVRFALENNPQLAAIRQQHGIAAAAVVIVKTYPFNPIYQSNGFAPF